MALTMPEKTPEYETMLRVFGGDRPGILLANALWRNGVRDLDAFRKMEMADIRDMQGVGRNTARRAREVRAAMAVDDKPVRTPRRPLPAERDTAMDSAQLAEFLKMEESELTRMQLFDSAFPRPTGERDGVPVWSAEAIRKYRVARNRRVYLARRKVKQ